jgi:hypothetical protein
MPLIIVLVQVGTGMDRRRRRSQQKPTRAYPPPATSSPHILIKDSLQSSSRDNIWVTERTRGFELEHKQQLSSVFCLRIQIPNLNQESPSDGSPVFATFASPTYARQTDSDPSVLRSSSPTLLRLNPRQRS